MKTLSPSPVRHKQWQFRQLAGVVLLCLLVGCAGHRPLAFVGVQEASLYDQAPTVDSASAYLLFMKPISKNVAINFHPIVPLTHPEDTLFKVGIDYRFDQHLWNRD